VDEGRRGMLGARPGAIGRYYLSFNLFALGNGLVGVFLNLFFLSNFSYLAVLYFQIATYATALTAYLLSGYAIGRRSPRRLYVVGLVLYALVLMGLLAGGGWFSNAFVFGALWGAATGVFYGGNNPLMHDLTRRANRTSFVAFNNLLTAVVTLFAPVSAGALIQFSTYRGVDRYLWDFAVTAAFFVLAAIVILRIRYDPPPAAEYSLRRTVQGPGPGFARFQLVFVASQLFAIPFGIILPIYVFQRTGSFVLTGAFASYTVLLSVLANLAFRRGFRRDGWFAPVAVAGILLSSLVMFTGWDPPADAFLFGGVYTVLATPLNNLVMVEFMERIDRTPGLDRVLLWSNREFCLGVGRLVVLAAMIALAALFLRNSLELVYVLPFLAVYAVAYLAVVRSGPGDGGRPVPVPEPLGARSS
jgi:MFS family permease